MDFINLKAQYLAYREEIESEIRDVISTQRFILGEKGKLLEKQLAAFTGTAFAVGVASGTDALILALLSLDTGPGDEIITTPFTFIATAEAISLTGATPVLVDIDRETFNIDPRLIEEKITRYTKGIIAVDLFGQPADYGSLMGVAKEYGLFVIEDGAQSLGALRDGRRAPSFADVGVTSFFPAKPLGAFGEGGMVFTDSEKVARKVESLRNHGQTGRYVHRYVGKNSRLDEIQAAVLLAKFRHFEEEIALRQEKARHYTDLLSRHVTIQKLEEGVVSTYAQYSLIVEDRDKLARHLSERNIPTAVHYPTPLHLQESFTYLGHEGGDFPVSEYISEHIISLPFSAFITRKEQDSVIEAVTAFLGTG
jgi:UDP-2-acetamido-2-deoxy-ribo-hexuluronate aminotransferase